MVSGSIRRNPETLADNSPALQQSGSMHPRMYAGLWAVAGGQPESWPCADIVLLWRYQKDDSAGARTQDLLRVRQM